MPEHGGQLGKPLESARAAERAVAHRLAILEVDAHPVLRPQRVVKAAKSGMQLGNVGWHVCVLLKIERVRPIDECLVRCDASHESLPEGMQRVKISR